MGAPALPQILEQLYALVIAEAGDAEDLAVKLGPLSADLDERDAIGVGVQATTEDSEPVGIATARVGLRAGDSYTITCVTQSFDGDDDLAAACRRASGLIEVLEAAVARLEDAVGPVWSAEVAGHAYRPLRLEGGGALAAFESTVQVEAMRQEQRR